MFSYARQSQKNSVIYSIGVLALFAAIILNLSIGAANISYQQIFAVLTGDAAPHIESILLHLRVPRMLLAITVGATMAICGAFTQGLFRNPLADPSLIGVSAGASAGASIVIVSASLLHSPIAGLPLVSFGAFFGGILTVAFVYRISTNATGTSVATMLLAGIAVNFLAGSVTSLLEYLGDNEALRRISLWKMGGLDTANYMKASLMATTTFLLLFTIPWLASSLNALLLGESEARHLGVNVVVVKAVVVIGVAIGVGVSVAVAGTIAFVGLIVPHMGRLLLGPNHKILIPFCAVAGAFLLLISDAVAKSIVSPAELPIGLITSIIGAPVFIVLLKQRHHYGMQS